MQNCRLLSTCVSSKATASGGGAGLSSPKLDTTDPVLSNNHHCSFLSKYCSLLLYIYPCLISKWHLTLCDLMDWSPLGSSFHEILRQEYRSGLPFPPPGDFPDLGVEPGSPVLQADSLQSEPPGKMYKETSEWSEGRGCICLTIDGQLHGIRMITAEVFR